MSIIEDLLRAYERFVRDPWDATLAGPQRVWFAIYDPTQERRLRFRLADFETATKRAGHGWASVDLSDAFAEWMAAHEYREAYFEEPDHLAVALGEFERHVRDRVCAVLRDHDAHTVVAVSGVAPLFGLMRVSKLVRDVESAIVGRLLVFFPGQKEGNNYRFLDARDGFHYLAIAITANEGD